jgi:hypothetical protein
MAVHSGLLSSMPARGLQVGLTTVAVLSKLQMVDYLSNRGRAKLLVSSDLRKTYDGTPWLDDS